MQWKKILFSTIIGIILFIADLKTGFIAFSLGGIPSIFLILFVVGILAGDASSGFAAAILTVLLGVGLPAVIPQILIPEYTFSTTHVLSRMWIIMGISVAYSTTFGSEPVPWLVGIVLIALLIIFAPFVFEFGLLFGLMGGLIGKPIHSRIFKTEAAPYRAPPQQPPPPVAPPPQDEPMEEPSAFEDEEPEEEEFEEDLSDLETE